MTITPIATRKTQSRVRTRGEFTGLFAATLADGTTGHLRFEYEWDKGYVAFEELHTDNPALAAAFPPDESPSAYTALDPHQDDVGGDPTQDARWAACEHRLYGG